MSFLIPFFAAFLQAGSLTLDKVVLSMKHVTYKTYNAISFPFMFLITLIIFAIFRPPLMPIVFSGGLLLLFVGSIFITISSNLILYRALDGDNLGEIQTMQLLQSLPIILFASLVFSDERNFYVLAPAVIATLAVAWSHFEKHHFIIRKKTLTFLTWSLIAAPVGTVIIKILLESWNPIAMQLFRSGVIVCILMPFFFRKNLKCSLKVFSFLMLTNILTTVAWILYYFSYQRFGIAYTVLIFSMQPLLVYFASILFLKERPQFKKIVAFVIVLVSIGVAQFLKG
ncbi:MAG: EamA family transporter [bacterium]